MQRLHSRSLQPDGKIVAAGRIIKNLGDSDIAISRYNSNGTLDSTFSTDGKLITAIDTFDDRANSIILQPDGKIIIAGYNTGDNSIDHFIVARYNSNGTLDSSFGIGGIEKTIFNYDSQLSSVILQSDGKILAAGHIFGVLGADFALIRYNPNGTLDSTFGTNGITTTDFDSLSNYALDIVLQVNGKVILAGSTFRYQSTWADFALARYNTNGTLDTTFGTDGKITTDFNGENNQAFSVAIQSDEKIVVGGYSSQDSSFSSHDFALARYLSGLNVGIVKFSESENNVLIYPNPIGETATLEYTLSQEETITIRLLDMEGKTIKTFLSNTQREAGSHQQAIILPATLPAGSYLIVIESEKGKMGVRVSKV